MTNRRAFLRSALTGTAAVASGAAFAMPTERPAGFDETFDVIVVGAGGAGLAAAAHAAESGLKVLILEKMAFPGGSSAICGGGSLVVGTELQKKAGEKDSNELFFKDIMETGGASTTRTSCMPSSTTISRSTTGSWGLAASFSRICSLRA